MIIKDVQISSGPRAAGRSAKRSADHQVSIAAQCVAGFIGAMPVAGIARALVRLRRGGTSTGVRCHCRTTIWARRHRRGPVEGTSPSHWTAYRSLRPPSLDSWLSIRNERRSRHREGKHTRSPHPRRAGRARSGFQGTGRARRWPTLGDVLADVVRFRPVSFCTRPGVAAHAHLSPGRTPEPFRGSYAGRLVVCLPLG